MKTKLYSFKVTKECQISTTLIKVIIALIIFDLLILTMLRIENDSLEQDLNLARYEIETLKTCNELVKLEAEQQEPIIKEVITYVPVGNTLSDDLLWTNNDILLIAQTLWGECRGCSKEQQSGVVWCILNRVDSDEFPNTISEVVTAPMQFTGYSPNNPVDEELIKMAEDVLHRWKLEKTAVGSVGRTLPKDYVFFIGNGKVNLFSKEFRSTDYWDWSLENPYI